VGAVIVLPDAAHEIDCSVAPSVLIAFVDPESGVGKAIGAPAVKPISFVPAPMVEHWRRVLRAPAHITGATVRGWFQSVFAGGETPRLDPRVARVVRALRARHGDLGRVSLAQLAAAAGLSPSRFAHLFTESVGIPVRRYLLWLRVQRAAASLFAGQAISDAAYGAGFSDGAHLSRTFRRMFGTAPRDIVRRQASARDIRIDDHPAKP
jgi:AraC-like DNA-binding protein